MSSQHTIGFGNDTRSSSRVIKPPGGGHTDFFVPAEEIKPHARPKYDQQNSSNLNFCMNTVDPNVKVAAVEPISHEIPDAPQSAMINEQSSGDASVQDGDKAVPAENLPKYHHHRSTALW